MSSEAEPILRALNAQEISAVPLLPFKFYEAHRSTCRIIISVNGVDKHHGVDSIGTESAALNTYCVIDRFKPDLVISAGTAGGWGARGAMIGDVYLSDQKFVHHDRRIGIAGFSEYGIGSYAAVPVSAGDPGEKCGLYRSALPLTRRGIPKAVKFRFDSPCADSRHGGIG